MENTFNQEQKAVKTHKFEFNFNVISLDDLKTLYKHFQVEEFGNVDEANDLESFLKCFIDGETDGNKDAYLLILLTAILANDAARIIEYEYTNFEGNPSTGSDLFLNSKIDLEFDSSVYDHMNSDGMISILITVLEYGIEEMVPLMKKYNFLSPI
jgi:hypothetical protein